MDVRGIIRAIESNAQKPKIVRTGIASCLLLGGGTALINYLNIKNNTKYINSSDDDERNKIYINLTGWSLLKGYLYGSFPLLSIVHMCYNVAFDPNNFNKHFIPGSRHAKSLLNL